MRCVYRLSFFSQRGRFVLRVSCRDPHPPPLSQIMGLVFNRHLTVILYRISKYSPACLLPPCQERCVKGIKNGWRRRERACCSDRDLDFSNESPQTRCFPKQCSLSLSLSLSLCVHARARARVYVCCARARARMYVSTCDKHVC